MRTPFRGVGASRWLAVCLLACAAACGAGERSFETGKLRLVMGRPGGGFIDEAFLDLDGDGRYGAAERVALRPEGETGVVVEVARAPEDYEWGMVAGVETVAGKVALEDATVADADGTIRAEVRGTLNFGELGKSPFTTTIEAEEGSAVLVCGLEFAPPPQAGELMLVSAGLRVFGKYMAWDRKKKVRAFMSAAGIFRNTPRPDSPWQPMTWQLGGRLVHSPGYWREWKAWSETCGPLTMAQGRVPDRLLTFHMCGPRQGMLLALKHPALSAPNELFGRGLPSSVTAYGWPPHAPPLLFRGRQVPEKLFMRNVGVRFFPVSPDKLEYRFYRIAEAKLPDLRKELDQAIGEFQTNLVDPRLPEAAFEAARQQLEKAEATGWAYEQDVPPPPVRGAIEAPSKVGGKDWTAVRIDANYELPVPQAPIRGGVALPKGACTSARQAVLLDEEGNEIPAQMERLAVWPDGSVKWLLVQAFADLPAGGARDVRLTFGPGRTRKARPSRPLEVEETPTGYAVDTGAIRFTLARGDSGFLDRVWLDGDGDGTYGDAEMMVGPEAGRRRNFMDLARVAEVADLAANEVVAESLEQELSKAEVEDITVERQGPISVDLCVKGRFRHEKLSVGLPQRENRGSEFWVRITAYAGKPYLRVKHTYVFEGNPDREHVQAIGLTLTPRLGDKPTLRLGDETTTAPLAGMLQDTAHSYSIWESDGAGRPQAVRAVGRAAPGWLDLSDARRGVTLGMRHMREMHAKELACEDGTLVAYVWPKRTRLLDTRRYARQYGSGESTSYGQGMAIGVSRTTELFVCFHQGEGEPAAVAQVFNDPPIVMHYPAWYASTEVFGPIHPYDREAFPKLETCMETWTDFWLFHRKLWPWYGIYDFGDFQSVNREGGRWALDDGRWGWINNEALVDMAFWLQFLRTGRRDIYRAAEACSRHVMEVDLINSTQYKTGQNVKMRGHRHNVNHWGDGYVGARVNACTGFKLHYFLTGDLRTRDQLDMVLASNRRRLGRYDCGGDTIGACLASLMYKWEATGERQYYDSLKAYVDFCCAWEDEHGYFPGHLEGWDFAEDRLHPGGERVGGKSHGMFFQSFGAGHTLIEFAELAGHQRLRRSLVRTASDVMASKPNWHQNIGLYPLMAAAYRYSGDRAFLEWVRERGTTRWVDPRRERWATEKCVAGMGKCMFGAWLTHGMPYLMDVIADREDHPVPEFQLPPVLRVPVGEGAATLAVDASATKPGAAELRQFRWLVDGETAAQGPKPKLVLPPGTRQVTLRVTDAAGRTATRRRKTLVWRPEVATRLCFAIPVPDGFLLADRAYDEELGLGVVGEFKVHHTSEPRPQFDRGCTCRRISGTLRLRLKPGRYRLEMGATDWWSTTTGPVAAQGRKLELAVQQDGKKLSWQYDGEVTVADDGLLTLTFGDGAKIPALVSYVVVTTSDRR
ncbi:MAG: hypothetical protein ACOC8A_00115 [bacterium]